MELKTKIVLYIKTRNMTKDIKVLMRHLGDGTWVIYDIPNIEDLYTITRK